MEQTVPTTELAARVAQLSGDMEALHRGLIDVGQQVAELAAKLNAYNEGLHTVCRAAGWTLRADSASVTDATVSRVRERRRRIAESGLRLICGSES